MTLPSGTLLYLVGDIPDTRLSADDARRQCRNELILDCTYLRWYQKKYWL